MKLVHSLLDTFRNDKLLQKVVRNSSYLLSSNVVSMGLSVIQSILAGRVCLA